MNSQNTEDIFYAPKRQDKVRISSLRAASPQPLTGERTARKDTNEQPNSTKRPSSTKRKTVLAAGWIDPDTNAVIEQRRRQSKNMTRSSVIAAMLKESAQRDAFERGQAILTPIIQETIRAEFHTFENRHISILARVAYQVNQTLLFCKTLLKIALQRDLVQFRKLEEAIESSARVNVARRTPQDDEVIGRMKNANMQRH